MTKLILTPDPDAAAAAAAAAPDATVVDVDEPFDRVVEALLPTDRVRGPSFVEQARRNARERVEYLEAHGALTAEEIADLASSKAANRRQTAYRWRSEGLLFAVEHRGEQLFPAFQIDGESGRPLPAVADALSRLPRNLTGWALALWWDTPILVDGDWVRPVDLLADPDRLVRAADAEAAGWARDGATSPARARTASATDQARNTRR